MMYKTLGLESLINIQHQNPFINKPDGYYRMALIVSEILSGYLFNRLVG